MENKKSIEQIYAEADDNKKEIIRLLMIVSNPRACGKEKRRAKRRLKKLS